MARTEHTATAEPELKRATAEAADMIKARILEGEKLKGREISNGDELRRARSDYGKWNSYNAELLEQLFTTKKFANEYSWYGLTVGVAESPLQIEISEFRDAVEEKMHRLDSILERLALIPLAAATQRARATNPNEQGSAEVSTVSVLARIAHRFHRVAQQLQRRHAMRDTLQLADEYDVQDLLHALLRLFFEDVRPEEYTPSYAGGGSRLDFLLKPERTVVECKMTRDGMSARELGEQLIIDIARYKAHPDCGTLVCLVYDPEGRIANPRGVESDLERTRGEPAVKVHIVP